MNQKPSAADMSAQEKLVKLSEEYQTIKQKNAVLKRAWKEGKALTEKLEADVQLKAQTIRKQLTDLDAANFNIQRLTKRCQKLLAHLKQQKEVAEAEVKSRMGETGSIFGLLFTKNPDNKDQKPISEQLGQDMEVMRHELGVKIQENEQVHMQMFQLRAEHKEQMEALEAKLEAAQVEIQTRLRELSRAAEQHELYVEQVNSHHQLNNQQSQQLVEELTFARAMAMQNVQTMTALQQQLGSYSRFLKKRNTKTKTGSAPWQENGDLQHWNQLNLPVFDPAFGLRKLALAEDSTSLLDKLKSQLVGMAKAVADKQAAFSNPGETKSVKGDAEIGVEQKAVPASEDSADLSSKLEDDESSTPTSTTAPADTPLSRDFEKCFGEMTLCLQHLAGVAKEQSAFRIQELFVNRQAEHNTTSLAAAERKRTALTLEAAHAATKLVDACTNLLEASSTLTEQQLLLHEQAARALSAATAGLSSMDGDQQAMTVMRLTAHTAHVIESYKELVRLLRAGVTALGQLSKHNAGPVSDRAVLALALATETGAASPASSSPLQRVMAHVALSGTQTWPLDYLVLNCPVDPTKAEAASKQQQASISNQDNAATSAPFNSWAGDYLTSLQRSLSKLSTLLTAKAAFEQELALLAFRMPEFSAVRSAADRKRLQQQQLQAQTLGRSPSVSSLDSPAVSPRNSSHSAGLSVASPQPRSRNQHHHQQRNDASSNAIQLPAGFSNPASRKSEAALIGTLSATAKAVQQLQTMLVKHQVEFVHHLTDSGLSTAGVALNALSLNSISQQLLQLQSQPTQTLQQQQVTSATTPLLQLQLEEKQEASPATAQQTLRPGETEVLSPTPSLAVSVSISNVGSDIANTNTASPEQRPRSPLNSAESQLERQQQGQGLGLYLTPARGGNDKDAGSSSSANSMRGSSSTDSLPVQDSQPRRPSTAPALQHQHQLHGQASSSSVAAGDNSDAESEKNVNISITPAAVSSLGGPTMSMSIFSEQEASSWIDGKAWRQTLDNRQQMQAMLTELRGFGGNLQAFAKQHEAALTDRRQLEGAAQGLARQLETLCQELYDTQASQERDKRDRVAAETRQAELAEQNKALEGQIDQLNMARSQDRTTITELRSALEQQTGLVQKQANESDSLRAQLQELQGKYLQLQQVQAERERQDRLKAEQEQQRLLDLSLGGHSAHSKSKASAPEHQHQQQHEHQQAGEQQDVEIKLADRLDLLSGVPEQDGLRAETDRESEHDNERELGQERHTASEYDQAYEKQQDDRDSSSHRRQASSNSNSDVNDDTGSSSVTATTTVGEDEDESAPVVKGSIKLPGRSLEMKPMGRSSPPARQSSAAASSVIPAVSPKPNTGRKREQNITVTEALSPSAATAKASQTPISSAKLNARATMLIATPMSTPLKPPAVRAAALAAIDARNTAFYSVGPQPAQGESKSPAVGLTDAQVEARMALRADLAELASADTRKELLALREAVAAAEARVLKLQLQTERLNKLLQIAGSRVKAERELLTKERALSRQLAEDLATAKANYDRIVNELTERVCELTEKLAAQDATSAHETY